MCFMQRVLDEGLPMQLQPLSHLLTACCCLVVSLRCHGCNATAMINCHSRLLLQALCSLPSTPERLLHQILSPLAPYASTTTPSLDNSHLPAALVAALKDTYNSSQQSAISSCLEAKCQLALVQGPPGTGKTSAIIGIISALLYKDSAMHITGDQNQSDEASRPKAPSYKPPSKKRAKLDNSTDSAKLEGQNKAESGPLKLGRTPACRVLVCAQSNAAIDELVARMATDGVWGPTGAKRQPALVSHWSTACDASSSCSLKVLLAVAGQNMYVVWHCIVGSWLKSFVCLCAFHS